jgi:hypothetical protein
MHRMLRSGDCVSDDTLNRAIRRITVPMGFIVVAAIATYAVVGLLADRKAPRREGDEAEPR